MKQVSITTLLIVFGFTFLFAQKGDSLRKGTLTGKVLDNEISDVLPFANVVVKEETIGTTTDFDGLYELSLPKGTYTIIFSLMGYETKEISGVVIESGEVTELNSSLGSVSNQLQEVIVKTTTRQNTEQSVLQTQKKSINMLDGISAQTFEKIGASNSAAAVKSVPGVSVQGGKYVYVRGLGDRYTKSILNGVDIPGLDPDRNTIQMDIFPTNIVDNIQVVKTFTANYPADFTGGVVNIITKNFPNKESYSVSLSAEYMPKMHFNSNYLTYKGSKTDILGFDNGKRNMPVSRNTRIPSPSENDPKLSYLTSIFQPEMKAKKSDSYMNTNIGFTAGNQYKIGEDKKIGYIASFNYKEDYILFEDYENGNYRKSADKSVYELEEAKIQKGNLSKNNVLLSGLAGLTLKTPKSKYSLTGLHIQNGISTAGYMKQEIIFSDAVTIFKDNIDYKQSQITNVLLSGVHNSENGKWKINWKLSPTLSKIEDKDSRVAPFQYDEDSDTYSISPSSAGSPSRYWRNLNQMNAVGILDLTYKHKLFNRKARVLFGGNYVYKQRDFSIDKYTFGVRGHSGQAWNGNADEILNPRNIWTVTEKTGTYLIGNYEPTNTFDAYQTVASGYISEVFQITENLKSIIGVRFEKFDMFYTGQNNQGNIVYNNKKVQDKADFFPSVNFIYVLNEETNLRAAYGRTTARPSFKEASITQIFDPISSTTFNGNINLKPTYIDNFDVRYEKFGKEAQMFAVSAFFKNFKDPIELTYFASATDQFQPQNLGSAIVLGTEFEIRKNFNFLGDNFRDFSINLNASLIYSQMEMSNAELKLRQLSQRDNEKTDTKRNLQGQSPYLINAGFNYHNEKGWMANLYYNVQGKTLQVVGTGDVPDVYTMPFNRLDFIVNKSFGKDFSSTISFSVKNILNDDMDSFYQSYKAQDKVFSHFSTGRGFSMGYTYKF